MTFVVDASVAAKWLIDEPDSELAARLLVEDLIAPDVIRLECANALIRRLRLKEISSEEATSKIEEIENLPVETSPFDEPSAFQIALTLRHPVFDCGYLALARARGVALITADRKFRDKAVAAGLGGRIRMLGDGLRPHP